MNKKNRRKMTVYILMGSLLIGILLCICIFGRSLIDLIMMKLRGEKTVSQVVKSLSPSVKARLNPYFKNAGLEFPLKKITLVALKKEKMLELWGERDGQWRYIRSYPILAASGKAGPKLKEGDRQVPEGIYRIIAFNPNGMFYLTMLVDYPNEFDRKNAKAEGRTNLGGDICIHGKCASIGCLAMGDVAAEELFILVALAGMENVEVIIAPNDLRREKAVDEGQMGIPWVPELYMQIQERLASFHVEQTLESGKQKESGR